MLLIGDSLFTLVTEPLWGHSCCPFKYFFYGNNVKQPQNLLLLSLKGSRSSEWGTWGRCFHSAGSFMGQISSK